ncbi:hypothetical protein ABE073_04310 [Lederbergia citrisecunda]|uniref:hypothetical protein n=1 Tax=Lederbergia citrisecunda TaxID=2833583 RepID=UPI003D26D49B
MKEKMFPQPTKFGTKVYIYERYANQENQNLTGEYKTYDIIHLDSDGVEKTLKQMSFKAKSEEMTKKILYREVNTITDILDIGAKEGQKLLKQGLNKLLK